MKTTIYLAGMHADWRLLTFTLVVLGIALILFFVQLHRKSRTKRPGFEVRIQGEKPGE